MKKILKIIGCLLLAINSYSQEGVEMPLGTTYLNDENGTYFKDINGDLNPYVGTWEGTVNNKKYTFVIQKFPKHAISFTTGYYKYYDMLKIKFKVTDLATNVILYSTLDAVNFDDFPIYGLSKPFHGSFQFIFNDTDANCQNSLRFFLDGTPALTNQLKYCKFEYDEWWLFENCPNYSSRDAIPVYLPKTDFILTKQ